MKELLEMMTFTSHLINKEAFPFTGKILQKNILKVKL